MRIILDRCVAVGAAKDGAVNAGGVPGGIDGDALTTIGLHAGLAVAGEAALILFQGLRRFGGGRLGAQARRKEGEQDEKESESQFR